MVHMMDSSSSLPSPSFSPYIKSHYERTMNSSKRPRSPETAENQGDRPMKRPAFALGEFNNQQLSHSSANSSRQGSVVDDWVQRAGGLTIDSPVYTPGEGHHPFLRQDTGGPDVDMSIEPDENESRMEESQEVVQLLTASTTSSHDNVTYQQQSLQYQEGPHTPHRHPYPTRYSIKQQSSMTPLINVAQVTPPHMPQSHQEYQIGQGNASDSPTPMTVSPPLSFAQITSPAKKRVVFGPRANCEKCRNGVPGHFIHYE